MRSFELRGYTWGKIARLYKKFFEKEKNG